MTVTLQLMVKNGNPLTTQFLIHPNSSFLIPKSRTDFGFLGFLDWNSQSRRKPFPVTKIEASLNESRTLVRRFRFDFLPILEFTALASAAAVSGYLAFTSGLPKCGISVGKILFFQFGLFVSCVVIEAVIRRRQWRRITANSDGAVLPRRVEKLEENLRNSVTMIRVLSRQIDKLGVRVRVNRKALQDPITETAASAQMNSESTRALAAQHEILDEEMVEIHKVLLAMQAQQQKQLDLILVLVKAAKLWGEQLTAAETELKESET